MDRETEADDAKEIRGRQNLSFVGDDEEISNGSLVTVSTDNNMDNDADPDSHRKYKYNSNYEFEEGNINKVDGKKRSNNMKNLYEQYSKSFKLAYERYSKITFSVLIYAIIIAYGIGASIHWNPKTGDNIDWCSGIGLLWLMIGAVLLDLVITLGKYFHLFDWMKPAIKEPIKSFLKKMLSIRFIHWIVYLSPLAALIIYLAIDTRGDTQRLISFLGLVVLILFGYIFSRHRQQIKWRPVVCGLTLQYIFGLLTIRWEVGRNVLQCVGDKVTMFLAYTNAGSSMVYGDFLIKEKSVFAFQVLSTIFFFSFFIQILYYYGIMQSVIQKLGSVLQNTMGTTACESINTAASIFVGMTESPLLIKPYIGILTKSELHAIMTGGLATIAGTVMAAYISFGVSAAHLITASVMSAPAALCYAKLFYPETEKTKTGAKDITMGRGDETNVLDAAASGAITAISLIQGIIANLIAFVSFVAFLNGIISWIGGLVGAEQLSFEWILSKVFIPLAWLLGVSPNECEDVATLMGLKTIVNEFVAYEKLATFIKEGKLSRRAEMIATYALCGFSNPGSLGILVGALIAMAPDKRADITELAVRSFIAGSATCFLTACVAGTLINESILTDMHSVPSNFTSFLTI